MTVERRKGRVARIGPPVMPYGNTGGWIAMADDGELVGIFPTEMEANNAYLRDRDDGGSQSGTGFCVCHAQVMASRKARPDASYRLEFSLLRRTFARLRSERGEL